MNSASTFRIGDGAPVASDTADALWARSAREALIETARSYHAVIAYKELAAKIVSDSGIKTSFILPSWIGKVLGEVERESSERGEPLLSSLCVRQDGTVGDGYGVAAGANLTDANREKHAAMERFKCNQHFGATMPDDGGQPAMTRQPRPKAERVSRVRAEPKVGALCPTCFMETSITGVCDNCD